MKKRILCGLAMCVLLIGIAATSQAETIQLDPIIANPASTENLWGYSYLDNPATGGPTIGTYFHYDQSNYDYVRDNATHLGYVTGAYGPWSATTDSFSSNGISDYTTTHLFDTYIMSSIDQTIRLRMSGDDGHSIFVDNVFMDGASWHWVGNNFTGETAEAFLDMEANRQYKLTLIGDNFTGPWAFWFSMAGTTEQGESWGGPVSQANSISMNATGEFAPVPEPATLLLLGSGLIGIAGLRRKFKK